MVKMDLDLEIYEGGEGSEEGKYFIVMAGLEKSNRERLPCLMLLMAFGSVWSWIVLAVHGEHCVDFYSKFKIQNS